MKLQHYLATATLLVTLSFSKLQGQTVYITESGKKYHSKDCSMLKEGKKSIALKDAIKQGYEPCQACETKAFEKEEKKKAEADRKRRS